MFSPKPGLTFPTETRLLSAFDRQARGILSVLLGAVAVRSELLAAAGELPCRFLTVSDLQRYPLFYFSGHSTFQPCFSGVSPFAYAMLTERNRRNIWLCRGGFLCRFGTRSATTVTPEVACRRNWRHPTGMGALISPSLSGPTGIRIAVWRDP
jgi:hypothetical protein